MNADGDAVLARLLYAGVTELLKWLGDYPEDEVDPDAVASIRQSIDWVVERLPAGQRDRLASGDPDPATLTTVTGLFVDLFWWLDTCEDDEVDLDVAVKLQESGAACVDELTDGQRRRLLEVLDGLAATERHDGRRYELVLFPYGVGLVDDEPDVEPPAVRRWVSPQDRAVGEAWARVEAGLSRVLPASLRQLSAPATDQAIDAMEAALAVPLAPDFRASLRIHNGTDPGPTLPPPDPYPVPLQCLYDTDLIVQRTREWRDGYAPEPNWDDPRVWAFQVDDEMIWLNGPVRPIVGSPGMVVVGDMNGDVVWLLDFDPAPGGTPGQVVRVDVECASWDVLAPSWTQLLVRYAEDLELFAADPDSSTLDIRELGPACEWGGAGLSDPWGVRPAWLRDVQARDPYPYHRADCEATAMSWRDERNERCTLDGAHKPHVFSSMDRHNPCGGGQTGVDKEADRRRWDHA